MKKKAFINIILLGFVLVFSVVVFLATTADDIVWKNKYFNLKKITDNHAFALAGAYHNGQENDSSDPIGYAEIIANEILNNSNLGVDASDYITVTWYFPSDGSILNQLQAIGSGNIQPSPSGDAYVTVTVTDYQHDNFWYRFLGKNQFEFDLGSTVDLIWNPDVPIDSLPIIVNGCDQDYNVGDEFDFLLGAFNIYSDMDNDNFYALGEPGEPPPPAQQEFSHFKNMLSKILNNDASIFSIDNNDTISIADVEWNDINNDVKMTSQTFDITDFEPTQMSIIVADCNSTNEDIIVQKNIPIKITEVLCGDDPIQIQSDINDGVDIFAPTQVYWKKSTPSCNSTPYFRIHFEVLEESENTNDEELR